jgi:hypothetical protein
MCLSLDCLRLSKIMQPCLLVAAFAFHIRFIELKQTLVGLSKDTFAVYTRWHTGALNNELLPFPQFQFQQLGRFLQSADMLNLIAATVGRGAGRDCGGGITRFFVMEFRNKRSKSLPYVKPNYLKHYLETGFCFGV